MSEPTKGAATRQAILDAALRLFADHGYDKTTMRAIAEEAGVSVGNAYYYFGSKDHLIQGYYDQIQVLHQQAATEVLATSDELGDRLRGVLHAWLEVANPYHEFAGQLFKNAADPRGPLSPFSEASIGARQASIATMAEVVDGSSASLDPQLRPALPTLLWLLQMGMVLYWVYDDSPQARRTAELIDGVVPLIERLVKLSRLRVLRSTTRELTDLLGRLGLPIGRR